MANIDHVRSALDARGKERLRLARAQHAAARAKFREAIRRGDTPAARRAVSQMTKHRVAVRKIVGATACQ